MRNSSIHAAAVVIAPEPLTNIVPLQLAEDTGKVDEDGNKLLRTVTQYSMKPIEELGLLKMDFLGLRNLDVIESALDIIEQSTGERPDMATLPLDDPKTYEMLARGHSVGVFQFESDGMRDGAAQGEADRVRGPRRARRPLPARARCATSTPTRATSATRTASRTSTSACARSPSRPTR